MGKEAVLVASVSQFPMSPQVGSIIFGCVAVDSLDYTHDYALELIEQLTGDKIQAEEIKNSRIQMLKSVVHQIFQGHLTANN